MTMQRTPLLLSTLMERGPWISPREEIVTNGGAGATRQSYADMRRRAHRLAHALAAHGIAAGDRVARFMWNSARDLELY